MNRITVKTALSAGIKSLQEANIEEAKIDAWYLLEYYLPITRTQYLMNPDLEITSLQMEEYEAFIKRRAKNIPLQYITGEQEFMGLKFNVSPAVLIPRQDTEILVEEVMKVAKDKDVLDVCTGSSCIITSIAKLCTLKSAVATDISHEALEIARKNINNHQVKVTLLQGDLFESVKGTFDIIVSNPPYIPTGDILQLMPEVKNHEPYIALDGKEDGLYFYKKIVKEAKDYLRPYGHIFFEIGYNQGLALTKLLEDSGYTNIRITKDLAGFDRVISATRDKW